MNNYGSRAFAARLAWTLAAAISAVAALDSCAMTPLLVDESGAPLDGSIAAMEELTLNGRREWVTFRGVDDTAPLLLFLAGGPGGSDLAVARLALGEAERHFVVIGWDQPGAGKSYGAIAHEDLTLDVYLDDASAPVDYALARFGAVNGGDTIGDIMSPEYGLLDKFRYVTGLLETLDCFYPKLWEEDLRDSVPELAVPAYFLLGQHDINASIPFFEDYFAALKAPD